jgi:type IV secretion system protein VirB8
MNKQVDDELTEYYRQSESWALDRERRQRSSLRIAWSVSAVAVVVALAEAIALVALAPLKTVVPYTLLVDRQTGYVQALKPLERDTIAPDRALTRSFLAQYVIAREGFQIESLKDDYRKVALWSTGEARKRYLDEMQVSNPASRLATLPRQALVEVEVRSISSLNQNTSLIRFATNRTNPGGQRQGALLWSAVITYQFSGAAMSEADRLINPLGFQVVRYRRDAEILPSPSLEVSSPLRPAPAPARTLP